MRFDGSRAFKRTFADFVFTRFFAFCLIQENQLSLRLQSAINSLISVLMAVFSWSSLPHRPPWAPTEPLYCPPRVSKAQNSWRMTKYRLLPSFALIFFPYSHHIPLTWMSRSKFNAVCFIFLTHFPI